MSKHNTDKLMAEITEYLCNECYWDLPCSTHGKKHGKR